MVARGDTGANGLQEKKINFAATNKSAWDVSLISKSQETKNENSSASSSVPTGLSRLAMFKKLAEEADRKDGANLQKTKSYFARGKFMPKEELKPDDVVDTPNFTEESVQVSKQPSVAEGPPETAHGENVSSIIDPGVEIPLSRRRPYQATLEADNDKEPNVGSKGMSALLNALSVTHSVKENNCNDPDSRIKKTSRKRTNYDAELSSPPRKVQRQQEESAEIVEKRNIENVEKSKPRDTDEIPTTHFVKPELEEAPATFQRKGGKRKNFDKPNFQRVNMKKKCFTRFGAAQKNRKNRLLKFRKRSNRASARREMREEAEWGLDKDTAPDNVKEESGDGKKQSALKIDIPSGPLSFVTVSNEMPDGEAFRDRVFKDLYLSDDEQEMVQKLYSGCPVFHQLSLPATGVGSEGWFHYSLTWSRVLSAVVEIHRHNSIMDGSGHGSAVALVVLCDPTCPLPLPSLKKAGKRAKAAMPMYHLGGAVITGDMSPDDRQDVVSRARQSEVSYIVCRPEMLLSSDWFRRSGLPPVACVNLLFAEKTVSAPWLANTANVYTSGKNNFCNVRADITCLIPRIYSLFEKQTTEGAPLLISSLHKFDSFSESLNSSIELSMATPIDKYSNDKNVQVFSSTVNKLTSCSKLLLKLVEKQSYDYIYLACETLPIAMRLDQLLRQDGNVAVHMQYSCATISSQTSCSKSRSIELIRIATQDDIVQSALQATKSSSVASTAISVVVTSAEGLPHVFAYTKRREQANCITVFVGIPPSKQIFETVCQVSECCVLVDASTAVETNLSLKSLFSLSGNLFLLKQITERLLQPSKTGDGTSYWSRVDIPSLASTLDCHPCLIAGILVQLYYQGVIIDIAGSRQDSCLVRLYGTDTEAVTLFEENPLLVSARRVECADDPEKTAFKSNHMKSLSFSMCELANEAQQHPDQIRRSLYQMRPTRLNDRNSKAFSQRSPLVITFSPQWSVLFKVDPTRVGEKDSFVMSIVNRMMQGEKSVLKHKTALANSLGKVAIPIASSDWDSNVCSLNGMSANPDNEVKKCSEKEIHVARLAIEDVVDSWSCHSEVGAQRPTPWSIARSLHAITLPGAITDNNGLRGGNRADWLPTMRVSNKDIGASSCYMHVSFQQLVELARQVLMS